MREIKCEITKAENGYVLSWEEEIDDNVFITKKNVYEEEYYCSETLDVDKELLNLDEEKVAFTKLVYGLAENLGVPYDKYSNKNVRISWDKEGHKY
jgi:hypothetical protein